MQPEQQHTPYNEHELGGSTRWKEGCHGRIKVTEEEVTVVGVQKEVRIGRAGPVGHGEESGVYSRYNRKPRSDRP